VSWNFRHLVNRHLLLAREMTPLFLAHSSSPSVRGLH
jgi:hypothetical protein